MKIRKRKYWLGIASVILFLGFTFLLFVYFSPEKIVRWVGIENGYLLLFITAIFGGFTTFNVIPYHLLLITFAVGGLNPFLLGLLAAVGVSLGDSTSYFLGYQGRMIFPEKAGKWFARIYKVCMERPRLFMFPCFLYSCIIPASNDFLTIPAGLARIPFWRIILPLVLGNIIFDISLANIAPYAYDYITATLFL